MLECGKYTIQLHTHTYTETIVYYNSAMACLLMRESTLWMAIFFSRSFKLDFRFWQLDRLQNDAKKREIFNINLQTNKNKRNGSIFFSWILFLAADNLFCHSHTHEQTQTEQILKRKKKRIDTKPTLCVSLSLTHSPIYSIIFDTITFGN